MSLRCFFVFALFCSVLFSSSLKKLEFEGNKELSSSFLYSNLNLVIDKAWYDFDKESDIKIKTSIIKPIKNSLINLYKSQGFYDVQVVAKNSKNKIIFDIFEGRAVVVKSVSMKSDFDIKRFIKLKVGDRFVTGKFISSREDIKSALHQKGYCNYDLTTKAYVDKSRYIANLVYKAKKNRQCKFGKITIETSKDIPKKVVLSRIFYRQDDPYLPKRVDESYNNLLSLGAFNDINIRQSNFGDKINTNIKVSPIRSKISKNIGIGYETQYGIKSVLHWEERNFKGGARKLAFDLKYSKNERFVKNTFFNPAFVKISFLGGYVDLKNEFVYSDTTYSDFKEKKVADKVHLQKDLEKYFIDFGIDVQNIDITKDMDNCAINSGNFFLVSPYIQAILDERDSKIDPKNGIYLSSYFESGLTYLGSSSSYSKLILEGRAIKTIENFTIAFKSKLGLINEFSKELPESKLFFAGGSFSNRAYGYDKLGAMDAKCDGVGGKTLLDNSLEIDHPIVGKLSFGIFWDFTMISVNEMDFDPGFVNAYGFGLRYKTLIGPLKFDIGFNSKDRSIYAIHFQIGQSF